MRIGTQWQLEWIVSQPPNLKNLAQLAHEHAPPEWLNFFKNESLFTLEEIPQDTDWLKETYKNFPPFTVGPFFIFGSHYTDQVPATQTGLQIDAATAFGSGEHGTTKGCLMAMLDLKSIGACPWNILDMGTGSGILGIAAWMLWKAPVLAVDNDEECVRVAKHHAALNNIPQQATDFTAIHGDGFLTPSVQDKKPFDLIIANILAGPLKEMADDLIRMSDSNGYVILSGILNEQADEVIHAYKAFALKKKFEIGEWTTLVLQNTAA